MKMDTMLVFKGKQYILMRSLITECKKGFKIAQLKQIVDVSEYAFVTSNEKLSDT